MPEITRRKQLAKTRLFEIEELDLRFENGAEVTYERMISNGNGAVLIVPMLDDDNVLMIREYAAGVHRYELALPKGKLEQGEDVLEGANREIMEEVGYASNRLEHLTSLTIAPGYLNHSTHIVLARELYPKRLEGDEPEQIEVVSCRLSELETLLAHPECTEARSIAALFLVREHLRRAD